MGTPHKHRDVIISWANGEEIEINSGHEWVPWVSSAAPYYETCEFRIKPKRVKKEGWVNVYPPYTGILYANKEVADRDDIGGRVACIRIEWEEEV